MAINLEHYYQLLTTKHDKELYRFGYEVYRFRVVNGSTRLKLSMTQHETELSRFWFELNMFRDLNCFNTCLTIQI